MNTYIHAKNRLSEQPDIAQIKPVEKKQSQNPQHHEPPPLQTPEGFSYLDQAAGKGTIRCCWMGREGAGFLCPLFPLLGGRPPSPPVGFCRAEGYKLQLQMPRCPPSPQGSIATSWEPGAAPGTAQGWEMLSSPQLRG